MSSQITYKYLPPGTEPTNEELSKAEPVSIRQVEDVEELLRHYAGEIIQVQDLRHGEEERSFKVVKVSTTPTATGFVGEPSTVIDNLNVYVTDAE